MAARQCLRAVAAAACLVGALGTAGDGDCVDQDSRWAAHGTSCSKMRRLCDDTGYGALVRSWCPRSCGLCPADAAAAGGEASAAPDTRHEDTEHGQASAAPDTGHEDTEHGEARVAPPRADRAGASPRRHEDAAHHHARPLEAITLPGPAEGRAPQDRGLLDRSGLHEDSGTPDAEPEDAPEAESATLTTTTHSTTVPAQPDDGSGANGEAACAATADVAEAAGQEGGNESMQEPGGAAGWARQNSSNWTRSPAHPAPHEHWRREVAGITLVNDLVLTGPANVSLATRGGVSADAANISVATTSPAVPAAIYERAWSGHVDDHEDTIAAANVSVTGLNSTVPAAYEEAWPGRAAGHVEDIKVFRDAMAVFEQANQTLEVGNATKETGAAEPVSYDIEVGPGLGASPWKASTLFRRMPATMAPLENGRANSTQRRELAGSGDTKLIYQDPELDLDEKGRTHRHGPPRKFAGIDHMSFTYEASGVSNDEDNMTANTTHDPPRKLAGSAGTKFMHEAPGVTAGEDSARRCPEGYEEVAGDVTGGDQWTGTARSWAESMEDCGLRCTRTPGCGSFAYSPSTRACHRKTQTRPTKDHNRRDFLLCRRAPCPSFRTEAACLGPSVAPGWYSREVSLQPGSYCIWSAGACQAPMACSDSDCFLPDGGLPGMELPRGKTLWISRAGFQASLEPAMRFFR